MNYQVEKGKARVVALLLLLLLPGAYQIQLSLVMVDEAIKSSAI